MNTTASCVCDCAAKVDELQRKVTFLRNEIEQLKQECADLQAERDEAHFGVHWIKGNDKKTRFYTGLPTWSAFLFLCTFLMDKAQNLKAWKGEKYTTEATGSKPGPRPWRNLSVENMLFAVLVRLRLGLLGTDVAARFRMAESTYSRLFSTWILFLAKELPLLFPWPSRERINFFMPACFKRKFPTTRVIIDCFEIQMERPTSLLNKSKTFSNYKSRNTIKFLVGISPSGLVTFLSDAWGGRVSDKAITEQSGLLDLLEKGDSVMADKGFDIEDILAPIGVKLNIPPKLGKNDQLTAAEVEVTRRIAEVRIHVERAIGRARDYHMLNNVFPVSMCGLATQIVHVAFFLTNFDEPLVR